MHTDHIKTLMELISSHCGTQGRPRDEAGGVAPISRP